MTKPTRVIAHGTAAYVAPATLARWIRNGAAVERLGQFALIYEGLVLLAREAGVKRTPPTISHFVWAARPRRFGWVLPVAILCWLGWHFEYGAPDA